MLTNFVLLDTGKNIGKQSKKSRIVNVARVEKIFTESLLQLKTEKVSFALKAVSIKIRDWESRYEENLMKRDISLDSLALTSHGDKRQKKLEGISVKNVVLKIVAFVNAAEIRFIYTLIILNLLLFFQN